MFPDLQFSCDGIITKWIIGGVEKLGTNPSQLQVWRRQNIENFTYTRVASYSIPFSNISNNTNIHEYYPSPPLHIKEGDILGLLHPAKDSFLDIYYQVNSGPTNFIYLLTEGTSPPTLINKLNLNVAYDYPLVSVVVEEYIPFLTQSTAIINSTSSTPLLIQSTSTIVTSLSIISSNVLSNSESSSISIITDSHVHSNWKDSSSNVASKLLSFTHSLSSIDLAETLLPSVSTTILSAEVQEYADNVIIILTVAIAVGGVSLIGNSICIVGICLIICRKKKKHVNNHSENKQPELPTITRQSLQENPLYDFRPSYETVYEPCSRDSTRSSSGTSERQYARIARPYEEWTFRRCDDGFVIRSVCVNHYSITNDVHYIKTQAKPIHHINCCPVVNVLTLVIVFIAKLIIILS